MVDRVMETQPKPADPEHLVVRVLSPVSDKPPGHPGWRDLGRSIRAGIISGAAAFLTVWPVVKPIVTETLRVLSEWLPAYADRIKGQSDALYLVATISGSVIAIWLHMLMRGPKPGDFAQSTSNPTPGG